MGENVAVRPLCCSACGALLSLGQGTTVRCPHCTAETRVPEEYGSLQRAARGYAEDRRLAESLYGRVGKPPGRFAMALAHGADDTVGIASVVGRVLLGIAGSHPGVGVLLFMATAYAIGFPIAAMIRAAYWLTRHPVPAHLSPYLVLGIATPAVVFLIGIPVVLLKREGLLATVRKDIHASLAAALPQRPGGPSLCRNCGAALDVPPGALGVPCTYCKADNLVALPASWVARVRSKEFHQFLRIDGALEAFRLASEKAREQVWMLTFGLVFAAPVVMLLAWLLTAATIDF
jgi:LSD1 subclass zinc finger protein